MCCRSSCAGEPRGSPGGSRLDRDCVRDLVVRYAYALVPLGAGIWLAHYSFHFLTGLGTIVPVTQSAALDAAGRALLGEPDWGWLGMRAGAVFPLQLGMVLLGALGSIAVAHRIAAQDDGGRATARLGALDRRDRPAHGSGAVDPRAADGDAAAGLGG